MVASYELTGCRLKAPVLPLSQRKFPNSPPLMLHLKLILLLGSMISLYGFYDFRHEFTDWRDQPLFMKTMLANIAIGGLGIHYYSTDSAFFLTGIYDIARI